MFTIKINTYKWEGDEKKFLSSYYFEGHNISVYDYFDEEACTKTLIEKYATSETLNVNSQDKYNHLVVLGYFTPDNEWKHYGIFDSADIYIMQSGKTVDRIVV